MRLMSLLGLAAVLLSLTGCLKDLEAPKWDVDLTLPLINETYSVTDLVNDSTFTLDEDLLTFRVDGEVQGDNDPDLLKIGPKDSNFLLIPSSQTSDQVLSVDETGLELNELGMPRDVEVQYAVVSSCLMHFHVQRNSQLESLQIVFRDLYRPAPSTERLQITLTAANTNNFADDFLLDLAGCRIGTETNVDYLDELAFTATSISSGGATNDLLRIYFDDNLVFSYFKGRLQNKLIRVDDQSTLVDVEFPDNISDAINLAEAEINLTVRNDLGFPTSLIATLYAYGEHGQVRHINLFKEGAPEGKYLLFDADTTENPQTVTFSDSVAYLLNIAPTRFELRDTWFMLVPPDYDGSGDGYVQGSAWNTDTASGNYRIDVPCRFTLNETTLTPVRVDSVEISEDNRKMIRENARSAFMDLTVDNHLPVGGRLMAYFSTSPDTTVLYTDHPEAYQPGVKFLRYLDDIVLPADTDNNVFHLAVSEEDVSFFDSPIIYFGFRLVINATDGLVTVDATDYVNIRGRLALSAHIDGDN